MSITNNPFIEAAENLFRFWLEQQEIIRAEFGQVFDIEYVPEPYLCFGDMKRPLIWVTMNPGEGFAFQKSPRFSNSAIRISDTYAQLAKRLAQTYEKRPDLITAAATNRIRGMLSFADHFGFTGVLQIERYPFHSTRTMETAALGRLVRDSPILREWEVARRQLLKDAEAIVALACASPADRLSPGVSESIDLLELALSDIALAPLRRTAKGVSQALWCEKWPKGRGVLVSQGALVVPKNEVFGGTTKYDQVASSLGWKLA